MDRSDFLRRAGLAGAGVASGLGSLARPAVGQAAPGQPRPNILFILTDDQPPHTVRRMPKTMSKIAAGGLDLTRTGYVAIPICGPARVCLLTGTYPHNNGTTDNTNPTPYKIYRSRRYFGNDMIARLKRAGYRTGFFGKLINGYGSGPDSGRWVHPFADRWQALVGEQGSHLYSVNKDGKILEGLKQNHTPYFGQRAEDFMRVGAKDNVPWFCFLSWTDPHVPFTPFRAFEHSHDRARYRSPGVSDTDYSDMSPRGRNMTRHGPAYHQEHYEGIVEELEGVDIWVSKLMEMLAATRQLKNTIVVFTSDNGYMLGEHGGLGNKSRPYEESARVPFLIRGPGIPTEAQGRPLVGHLDLTATICDAAGARTEDLDGRSLRELGNDNWRERLLVEHPGCRWSMVRDKRYVYIDLVGKNVEIYDLVEDPYQTQNIADTIDPQTKEELRLRLVALRQARGRAEFAAAEA